MSAPGMQMEIALERWPLRTTFRITGHVFTEQQVVVVTLRQDGIRGRGEASGVYYLDDTPERIVSQLEAARPVIEAGVSRAEAQQLLPPGGARNALDCALWELESHREGRPVWQLAGLDTPRNLLTTYTLSADAPEILARTVTGAFASAVAIKLKLNGDGQDDERIRRVREARPDAWLCVDANQGLTPDSLRQLWPTMHAAGIQMIEQPFCVGREAELDAFELPVLVAADESIQTLADLDRVAAHFDMINIKLDKCGGLTEGLRLARAARERGLGVMVGNMMGTSLAMAPAFLVGQLCDVVDLDGPLGLAYDRDLGVRYDHGQIVCDDSVWGAARS
jgi:L-alanine-DL-glutamate epimerase-like enolase superfamily enzyme